MNFWGFTPRLFPALEAGFKRFLDAHRAELKSEYLIPTAAGELIKEGKGTLSVLTSNASWFGVTYPQDKPVVQQAVQKLVSSGAYPTPLWA